MKNVYFFIFACTFLVSCNDAAEWQSKVAEMEVKLATAEEKLAIAEETLLAEPGMIHSVFFWLDKNISGEDEGNFLEGVKSLKEIKTIQDIYIGPPAATEERGVVDNTYSYALIVHFRNLAGHDAYQVDPIHSKFVDDHKDKWTKVLVYDSLVKY